LVEQVLSPGFSAPEVLSLAASLERYSKHPLALAIVDAAKSSKLYIEEADHVSEKPGGGILGKVRGREAAIVGRKHPLVQDILQKNKAFSSVGGLECFVLVDGRFAAAYRFHDTPRADGSSFISHLGTRHQFARAMIISGDRESEVRYLAEKVGITEIHAGQSPEQKLELVRRETARAKTLYIGDGINDAPALMTSTVGIAVGQGSDVTSEAASVVILDHSLKRLDEFMHISERMRRIALQSAVGGMLLSLGGMAFAAMGMLTPVAGAITQEVIDVLAIANALRAAWPPRVLSDFDVRS